MKRGGLLAGCFAVAALAVACGRGSPGDDPAPEFDPTPAAWFGQSRPASFDVLYELTDEGLDGEHQLRWARDDYNERIDYAFGLDSGVFGTTTLAGPWLYDSTCNWRTEDTRTFRVQCPGISDVYGDILAAIFDGNASVQFDGTEVVLDVEAPCYSGTGGGRPSYWQADFRVCLSETGVPLLIEANADAAGGQGAEVRLVALESSPAPETGWDSQVVDVSADASEVDVSGVEAAALRLPDMPLLRPQ